MSIPIPIPMRIAAMQPCSHAAMQLCSYTAMQPFSHLATLGLESFQPLQPSQPLETFGSHYSNGDISADHAHAYTHAHTHTHIYAYCSHAVIQLLQLCSFRELSVSAVFVVFRVTIIIKSFQFDILMIIIE